MSRKLDEPTVSRHIELFAADWDFLTQHFGRDSDTKLGVSVAVRQMIRQGVRRYQERLARRTEAAGGGAAAVAVSRPLDAFFKGPSTPQISEGEEI